MPEQCRNYINGEWIASSNNETFEVHNPAHNDEIVSVFPQSTTDDANRAVEGAASAASDWASTPGPKRGAILRETASLLNERADDIARTLTREEGKTFPEAQGEVNRAVDIFYYYAEKARDFGGTVKQPSDDNSELYTVKEPLGVTALITPWNYPIAIPAWKLAPALATGNTVVLKPASQAPTVAYELVQALVDAGIPDGVVNLITGPGRTVGETVITHDEVDAVSFTGSSTVGNHVFEAASEDQKRVQTEMGGKNPTVVMPSADVDEAADIVGAGAFGVTGQACTATSRAIVHEDVYDEFVAEITEYADSLSIGDGLSGADMGPQISESELDETLEYIHIARNEGATLQAGGNRPNGDGFGEGYFVEPTVFVDVDPDMRIACEEVFGPVLGVIPVSDFEEALAVANDSEYGLSASIVTQDISEAHRFIAKSETGVTKVNEKTTGLELHVPFGGVKQSSSETYREQGDAGIDFFTKSRTIYLNY